MLTMTFGEIVRLPDIYHLVGIEQNIDIEVHLNSRPRGQLLGQGSNLRPSG